MKFTVIIPAHNEQENIAEVINEVEQQLDLEHDLIIVDDHSLDATPRIVEGLFKQYSGIRLVRNTAEAGFANALKAGISVAKTEVVIPVMADLCDDLDTIKEMYEKINEGYDVVCGARYIKGGMRLGGSKIKGFFSIFVGRSLYYLLDIPTHDIANAFKMYRKKVIESIKIESKAFEVSMEIPLKAYYQGFKITEVPTTWKERTKGKSSFKMFRLFPNYFKLYLWAIFKRFTG